MNINKIKRFVRRNKNKIINAACVILGGIVVYSLKRTSKEDTNTFKPDLVLSTSIVNEMANDPDYNFSTFDEAANQFKKYQGVNNSVGMLFDDNNYQVFQLEEKKTSRRKHTL